MTTPTDPLPRVIAAFEALRYPTFGGDAQIHVADVDRALAVLRDPAPNVAAISECLGAKGHEALAQMQAPAAAPARPLPEWRRDARKLASYVDALEAKLRATEGHLLRACDERDYHQRRCADAERLAADQIAMREEAEAKLAQDARWTLERTGGGIGIHFDSRHSVERSAADIIGEQFAALLGSDDRCVIEVRKVKP